MKDCICAQMQLNTKNMFISVFILGFVQEHIYERVVCIFMCL